MAHSRRTQLLMDNRQVAVAASDVETIVGVWNKAMHSAADARSSAISLDTRVDAAFKAVLQAAHALSESFGYRVPGASHHRTTFVVASEVGEPGLEELSVDMEQHQRSRAAAVYEPLPAEREDLESLLAIVERLDRQLLQPRGRWLVSILVRRSPHGEECKHITPPRSCSV
ncbi:MAG: hypothetical protein ACT4P6_20410 [Gemmatimonadaceae bacterium]